jgi:hypothetical protein
MKDRQQILRLVLDELIPPSTDGRLPGAGSLGVAASVEDQVSWTPELHPVFVPTLLMLAYAAYYGNERVVAGLKPETHAPHPRGYEVEADDEALLEPVRSRGKLYRDC